MRTTIHADAWFDGTALHREPLWLRIDQGRIAALHRGVGAGLAAEHQLGFVMPGMVEAHAHLFLDGGELDLECRKAYLAADIDTMLATGRANLARSAEHGITLIRDAGDRYGVNHRLRSQWRKHGLRVRSPGLALRKRGRYGSFMGEEVDGIADIEPMVARRAAQGADDCKVLLTGIIDFAAAAVKGAPQFDLAELQAIVKAARLHGLPTFAHCSGRAGIDLAIRAGIDSIEHGFFMESEDLDRMAAARIAWVPTWSPVAFVRDNPALIGLDQAGQDGVARILDQHLRMIGEAHQRGVRLIAGSDAGSYGVVHGPALINELRCFRAAGVPLEAVLHSATSAPRQAWAIPGGRITTGAPADLAAFSTVPDDHFTAFEQAELVLCRGEVVTATLPA
ncbi:MAG: amidohydrolase family protein [Planctomycetota bacterium]|jgi:imidazolonepropionase-like amidohydrolase|nr:amidohydrolase family protein [Planctomycetota bacterium]